MPKPHLTVSVITPERVVFEGVAEQVIAPAWDGKLGILVGHAPLMALLSTGEVRVDAPDGEKRFDVSGGFIQVADDNVVVLTE